MLKKVQKNITITSASVIDEKEAEGYSATIDSTNPQNISISCWQIDKNACKENREQCRKDRADFEDAAYALQDDMVKEAIGTVAKTK